MSLFRDLTSLQHLLDTEDIIHGLARVAYAVTEPASTSSSDDSEIANGRRDLLIDLTPDVLTTIKKNKERWSSFVGKVRSYCCPAEGHREPILQKAFECMYEDLRYNKTNSNGFSLVQLAQPDRIHEGISPLTLHPLLYCYLQKSTPISVSNPKEREEMLRWVLFANGFTNAPTDARLNREVFRLVLRTGKIDFLEIKKIIFNKKEEKLRRDLGFHWYKRTVQGDNKVTDS